MAVLIAAVVTLQMTHLRSAIRHLSDKINALSQKVDDFKTETNQRLSNLEAGQSDLRERAARLEIHAWGDPMRYPSVLELPDLQTERKVVTRVS